MIDPSFLPDSPSEPLPYLRVLFQKGQIRLQGSYRCICRSRKDLFLPFFFLPGPGLHPFLPLFCIQMDLRMVFPDPPHQGIHVLFRPEIALAGPFILQFHHQIRDRRKEAPARKSSRAHGDPLVDALYVLIAYVESAVQEKGVEIQCPSAQAAGACLDTCFPVVFQFLFRKFCLSKLLRKHTLSFPPGPGPRKDPPAVLPAVRGAFEIKRGGESLRPETCLNTLCYAAFAFFALLRKIARNRTAAMMPAG